MRDFNVVDVVMEVRVSASPQRTWAALTRHISSWWPAGFFASERAKRFVLEPRLGGLAYEEWGEGQGLVWYQVTALNHGTRLVLSDDLHPALGGPARVYARYHVEPDGDACVVRLEDTVMGAVAPSLETSLREGWGVLLEALRGWCERPR
jgi:uncharacterized protein YndB with AHSA1/START domain